MVIDHQVDDYSFGQFNFIGSLIYLFDVTDFLDEVSGGTINRIVEPDDEMFMSMNVIPVIGSNSMRPYSPEVRGCLFEDENILKR